MAVCLLEKEEVATKEAKIELTDPGESKRRMLCWPNPVEFVNNMYSCHPGDESIDYFDYVFGRT